MQVSNVRLMVLTAGIASFALVQSKPAEAGRLIGSFSTTGGPSGSRVKNWNGVEVTELPRDRIHTPKTIAKLQALIRKDTRIRVVGAGHSFNDSVLPEPGGALVQLMGLNEIEKPIESEDGKSATVWVGAGATIAELTAHLAKAGWALETLPTSQEITIAGAVNGVHGSSLRHPGSISEQVVDLEVVDQHGDLQRFAERGPEEMRLARVHLGLLGAVTRVQLRVVPQFNLVGRADYTTGDVALQPAALRKSLSEDHDYLLFMSWDPVSDKLTRRWLDIVPPGESPQGTKVKTEYQVTNALLARGLYGLGALTRGVPGLGKLVTSGLRALSSKPPASQVGPSHLMFQTDADQPVNHDTSFGLPLEAVHAATRELSQAWKEIGYAPSMRVAIRVLPATKDIALAMNSDRETAVVEFLSPTVFDDALFVKARRVFEEVMVKYDGRPHWQKEGLREDSLIQSPAHLYKNQDWAAFLNLSNEAGGDKFGNPYTDRVLPR